MLAEISREDYIRKELIKVEKQKRIIYQKIAIMLSMKNIHEITREKLELMLRRSDSFTQNELDLVFGQAKILKEENYNFFSRDLEVEEDEVAPYMLAKEFKRERESTTRKFGLIPEYI